MNKNYCPKCGLQYRKWSIEVAKQVCEDCEPIEYEKLRKPILQELKTPSRSKTYI